VVVTAATRSAWAVVLAVTLAAGCGAGEARRPATEPNRVLGLREACPGVHVAYDGLVAADPVSARAFEESVRRLWQAGVDETRAGVTPVLEAAGTLARADRVTFPAARDRLYAAVSRLSAACASLGSPILH
jgi:hypothetical protein